MHERHSIHSIQELSDSIRAAQQADVAVYPVGGETSLDFGLPAKRAGWTLDLTPLNQVIDYPAADMTITVSAGMRIDDLQTTLRQHQQQLPLDIPQSDRATVGGVLATNFSGSRRLGYGTARDYVIGIRAVDGRGEAFAGGGRVVKNVAGYDFCKLLIGSLGTLGVLTEVTFKLRPLAEATAAIIVAPRSAAELQRLLDSLTTTQITPVGVDWLVGPTWSTLAAQQHWPAAAPATGWLVVLLEGSATDIHWMQQQLRREWNMIGNDAWIELAGNAATSVLSSLTEFPAQSTGPIVIKASLRPSAVAELVSSIQQLDGQASIQAHAVNGVVRASFAEVPSIGLGKAITAELQPLVQRSGGSLTLLVNREGLELTPSLVWGRPSGPLDVMRRIKQEFDPHDRLNPGRFVYGLL